MTSMRAERALAHARKAGQARDEPHRRVRAGDAADTGPRRITDLAEAEAVAQPTITTLVGRLERDGLVRRAPDPATRGRCACT